MGFCLGGALFGWLAFMIGNYLDKPKLYLAMLTILLAIVFFEAAIFKRNVVKKVLYLSFILLMLYIFGVSSVVGFDIVNETRRPVDVYVLDLNSNRVRYHKIGSGEKHWQLLSVIETPAIMNDGQRLVLALDDNGNVLLCKRLHPGNVQDESPVIIRRNETT